MSYYHAVFQWIALHRVLVRILSEFYSDFFSVIDGKMAKLEEIMVKHNLNSKLLILGVSKTKANDQWISSPSTEKTDVNCNNINAITINLSSQTYKILPALQFDCCFGPYYTSIKAWHKFDPSNVFGMSREKEAKNEKGDMSKKKTQNADVGTLWTFLYNNSSSKTHFSWFLQRSPDTRTGSSS